MISTTSSVPTGTQTVTIRATTAGAPDKTQSLALTIISTQDYAIGISNPSMAALAGNPVTYNGTVTAINGYNSAVNLGCGAGKPPNCVITPPIVTPSAAGVPFSVTASSGLAQNYNFNIVGQGTDASALQRTSASLTLTATFDFALNVTAGSGPITAGQSAIFNLEAAPIGGGFPNGVAFACSGLPSRSTCSFSPSQIATGSPDTEVAFTVATTAPVLAAVAPASLLRLALLLPAAGLISVRPRRSKNLQAGRQLLCVLALLFISPGCGGGLTGGGGGGGGQPGTPPGSYPITITATSGSLSHTAQVTLTVQ